MDIKVSSGDHHGISCNTAGNTTTVLTQRVNRKYGLLGAVGQAIIEGVERRFYRVLLPRGGRPAPGDSRGKMP